MSGVQVHSQIGKGTQLQVGTMQPTILPTLCTCQSIQAYTWATIPTTIQCRLRYQLRQAVSAGYQSIRPCCCFKTETIANHREAPFSLSCWLDTTSPSGYACFWTRFGLTSCLCCQGGHAGASGACLCCGECVKQAYASTCCRYRDEV